MALALVWARQAAAGDGQARFDWAERALFACADGGRPAETRLLQHMLPDERLRAEGALRRALLAALREAPLCPPGLVDSPKPRANRSLGEALRTRPSVAALLERAMLSYRLDAASYADDGRVRVCGRLALDGGPHGLGGVWAALWHEARPSQAAKPLAAPPPRARAGVDDGTTGFVISARGAGNIAGLWPRVVDEAGQTLYDAGFVEPEIFLVWGAASFVPSLDAAFAHPRVAEHAVLLRASSAHGDVVLPAEDAARLRGHPQLVREARVVFVTDAAADPEGPALASRPE